MKIEIVKRDCVDVRFLAVAAEVRYWEDATLNGEPDNERKMPFRKGNLWMPKIDVDRGIIVGWPKGTTAEIHYKVCDAGSYALQDEEGNTHKRIDGYVPCVMCPKENGYGDYIIMDIDVDGNIADWDANALKQIEDD